VAIVGERWQRVKRQPQQLVLSVVAGFGLLMLLYGSHSRSAWLGFAVAVGVYVLLSVSRRLQLWLVCLGVVGVLVFGLGVSVNRNNSFVQNVILHDNPEIGPEQTSNSDHLEALRGGIADIVDRPVTGCAPGCAGPASFYDPDGAKLAENYYLQVGQEVGVIGLGLFAAIVGVVAVRLYRQRLGMLSRVMLASLVGLSIANLLLHVWADDTLAYVWWGVLGLVLLARKQQSEESQAQNQI